MLFPCMNNKPQMDEELPEYCSSSDLVMHLVWWGSFLKLANKFTMKQLWSLYNSILLTVSYMFQHTMSITKHCVNTYKEVNYVIITYVFSVGSVVKLLVLGLSSSTVKLSEFQEY